MAVTAETLEVRIQAEVKKAVREMKKVEKQTGKIAKESNNLSKMFKTGLSIGVAVAAFNKLTKAAGAAIDAFREQEQAERRLEQAAANNPLLNGSSIANIQEFASQLQQVSTVGDETAIRLASIAAASGRSEEEITKMVQAAADVSAAMGITMDSAIRSLNKSFGGLTGELGELVPELQTLSKEQLEAGEGVDLIREKFDGAAAAIGDTATGAIQQFKNSLGDLRETIGGLLANALQPLIKTAQDVVGHIQDIIETQRDLKTMQQGGEQAASLGLERQLELQQQIVERAEATLTNRQAMLDAIGQAGGRLNQNADAARERVEAAQAELRAEEQMLSRLRERQRVLEKYSSTSEEYQAMLDRQAKIDELILTRENARVNANEMIADAQEDLNKGLITQEEHQQIIQGAYEQFLETARDVLDEFESMGETAPKTEQTIRNILSEMEGLKGESEDVAKNFERIAVSAEQIMSGGGIQAGVPGLERSRGAGADLGRQTPGGGMPDATGGGDISGMVSAAGGALAGFAASIVSSLGDVVSKLIGIFKQAIVGSEAVTDAMDKLKEKVASALEPAAKALADAILPLIPTITKLAQNVGQLLIPIFQGIGGLFQSLMPVLLAIVPAMQALGEIIASVFIPLWQTMGSFIAKQIVPLFSILGSLLQLINPALQIWGKIMGFITEQMMSRFLPVLNAVVWVFQKLTEVSRFLWNNALMPFGNMMLGLARDLADGFDTIINGILGAINGLIRRVNDRFGSDISTLGYVNLSGRVPGDLSRISAPGETRVPNLPGVDEDEDTGGGGATIQQARPIDVTINIFDNNIAGDGSFTDLAREIRDEFVNLGVINL